MIRMDNNGDGGSSFDVRSSTSFARLENQSQFSNDFS